MAASPEPAAVGSAASDAGPSPLDGTVVRRIDDTIVEETPFAGGVIDGEAKTYATEGWLLRTAAFKAGRLDGETIEYDSAGNPLARFTFAEGRLDGPATLYANGRPSQQMTYADGVLCGEMRSFDASGCLIAVAHYAQGRLNGEAKQLRPDGSPIRAAQYRDGMLDGEVVDYRDDGSVRQRALYKDNLPDGPTTTYSATGQLEQQTIFAKGIAGETRPATPESDAKPRSASWIDRLISGA